MLDYLFHPLLALVAIFVALLSLVTFLIRVVAQAPVFLKRSVVPLKLILKIRVA